MSNITPRKGKYFICYDEAAKINYTFLFALYIIAESDNDDFINNVIRYSTLEELKEKIKFYCNYDISVSTISRILKDEKYLTYFIKPKGEKIILLNNDFRRGTASGNKFIVLEYKEIAFLIYNDDNLLTKYYLYIKYYCGYSKSKRIDTTAEQILEAIGYSTKNGNNKT